MSIEKNPKGLLFVVDGKENNILQIASRINPRFVSFVATSNSNLESAVAVSKKIKETDPEILANYDRMDQPDVGRLFQSLYRSFVWLRTNELEENEIAVGLTGEEEKTIAICGIFATFFRLRSFYYVPKTNISEERVVVLADPDDISGFIDARNAVSHFNAFDFPHAGAIIKSLVDRSSSLKNRMVLESLQWLSEAYLDWDSFRYHQAAFKVGGCIEKLKKCLQELGQDAQELVRRLKQNSEFVSSISKCREKKTTSPLLALDLFLNGYRRYYERNCNDALVRLYRALECCVQHRLLSQYGIDSSSFSKTFNKIRKEKLQKFLEMTKRMQIPYSLALSDSVALLRVMEDSFVSKIDDDYLRKIMNSRNYCILAHGYEVVRDETFLEFAREVESVLKIFFEIEGLDYSVKKIEATYVSLDSGMLTSFLYG
jgi:CRISPR-associated protein (TIGR02710 family)